MAASGDLVARADEAMYAAKRSGRNRVCSAEEGEQTDSAAQAEDRPEDRSEDRSEGGPEGKDPQGTA
jgi:predicted signal transduction protein with EAL and GGDEF domain